MNTPCHTCGELKQPYQFVRRDSGEWYSRYRCEADRKGWEIRTDWDPVDRANWYRDNVLTKEGLDSPATPMPWDEATA